MENKLDKLCKLENLCGLQYNIMKKDEILKYLDEIFDMIETDFSEESFVREKLNGTDRMYRINVLVNKFSKKYGEVNFKPFQRSDNTYGLCAKNKIDPGTFVTIPYEEILCLDKVRNESEYQVILESYPIKKPKDALFSFMILLEFYRMEKSEYYEYLMSLPSTLGNVVEFDREDFRLLSYTEAFLEAWDMWVRLIGQFAKLHVFIINWINEAPYELKRFFKSIDIGKKFCLKDYMWAVGIVMTRNFPYDRKELSSICLVPIMDLCNHHDDALTPLFSSSPKKYAADTNSTIMIGEEIFIKCSRGVNMLESLVMNGMENMIKDSYFATLMFPFRSVDKYASFKQKLLLKYTQTSLCTLRIWDKDWWHGKNTQRLRIFVANTEELEFFRGLSKEELESLLQYKKACNQRNENMCFFLLSHKFKEVFANLEKLEEITKSRQSEFIKYLQMAAKAEKQILLKAVKWFMDTYPEFEHIYN